MRSVAVVFALVSLTWVSLQRADAATFDFATLAQTPGGQGGGEGFWNNQITTAGDVYTVGGVGVVASAFGSATSQAYLDAFSGAYQRVLALAASVADAQGLPTTMWAVSKTSQETPPKRCGSISQRP